jgi:hypothetical protein
MIYTFGARNGTITRLASNDRPWGRIEQRPSSEHLPDTQKMARPGWDVNLGQADVLSFPIITRRFSVRRGIDPRALPAFSPERRGRGIERDRRAESAAFLMRQLHHSGGNAIDISPDM